MYEIRYMLLYDNVVEKTIREIFSSFLNTTRVVKMGNLVFLCTSTS